MFTVCLLVGLLLSPTPCESVEVVGINNGELSLRIDGIRVNLPSSAKRRAENVRAVFDQKADLSPQPLAAVRLRTLDRYLVLCRGEVQIGTPFGQMKP